MNGKSRSAAAPVTAVFAVETSRISQSMMAEWLAAGHRIAAVLAPATARRRKRAGAAAFVRGLRGVFSVRRRLERSGAPYIEIGDASDWDAVGRRLERVGAEVLICFAFPALIPQSILSLFPHGGLNLHPALLPDYRGPFPIHRLVLDDSCRTHGGVTLHRMTAAFDAGDIFAQAPFGEADWRSLGAFQNALAAALMRLTLEAAPQVMAGAVRGSPQPAKTDIWASLDRAPLVVSSAWTSSYLRRLLEFLGNRPGVAVELDGRRVRLAPPLKVIGPAEGGPLSASRRRICFDLADARVACRRRGKFALRLARLRARLDRWRLKPAVPPIVYPGTR